MQLFFFVCDSMLHIEKISMIKRQKEKWIKPNQIQDGSNEISVVHC